jgi:hypothetical protein
MYATFLGVQLSALVNPMPYDSPGSVGGLLSCFNHSRTYYGGLHYDDALFRLSGGLYADRYRLHAFILTTSLNLEKMKEEEGRSPHHTEGGFV